MGAREPGAEWSVFLTIRFTVPSTFCLTGQLEPAPRRASTAEGRAGVPNGQRRSRPLCAKYSTAQLPCGSR